MIISNNAYFKPKFESIQTVTEKVPEYEGEYNITPTEQRVILPTSNKKLSDNIIVGAVEPVEVYEGQYNVTPTTTQIILPTTGKKLMDDITVEAVQEPEKYTDTYIFTPKRSEQTIATAGKLMTNDITIKKSNEDAILDASIVELVNDTATTIMQEALSACKKLEVVKLSKVTMIYAYAFRGCTSLRELWITKTGTIPTLGNVSAFDNTPIGDGTGVIYVPQGLLSRYSSTSQWRNLYAKGIIQAMPT